ncbi:hypothetical protein B0H14DRAFT_2902418 [Mycena olivaceomarginata]|nr:hypothetical protein B0H14DRAFT_2902418 [Mycena olivaceomarginata]
MTTTSSAHAIVFGASGLAGWAVVDQLLQNYPKAGTFSKVTAVVNRPISLADSFWPTPESPSLDLVTGINLAEGSIESFTALLGEKIKDISTVTHVYYFVYKQDNDAEEEIKRVLGAVESLCPNFRFLAWPSGTLGYGIYKPGGGPFKPPYKESMGRLPPPDTNFYYNWTWCEVGFSPNGSTYSEGASVPYPGTEKGYDTKFNDASSEIIAKLAIWASLHPEKSGGQLFNIADRAEPSTMRERWPALAAFFRPPGEEYARKHQDVLKAKCKKPNEVFGAAADRQLSLEKIRAVGFLEEIDPLQSSAGMVPG